MKQFRLLIAGLVFGGLANGAQAADGTWSIVGVEGGLSYTVQDGDYVTPFGSQDSELDWASVYVGLNFANGSLSETEPRWIITPFASYAFDGEQALPAANASTDFGSGYFDQYEIGARIEREQQLNPVLSWSLGASLSYVKIETRDVEATGYWEREQDGLRAAVFVGLARQVSDSGAVFGRIGYSSTDLNESYECRSNAGGPCISTPAFADDDTSGDGPVIEFGYRHTF